MDSTISNPIEKIPTEIFETSLDASKHVASQIAKLIRERAAQGKQAVLGLATGSTPTKLYDELVRLHKEEGLSFKNVITFNLDEYFPMEPHKLQSYHKFMNEHLFDSVDILKENVHIPDGNLPKEKVEAYCENYEKKIQEVGGLDIQVLGIGKTGHIGFNEPGSTKVSKTRLVYLDKVTIIDAASDFFGHEYVPKMAITMGIGTIMSARKIYILAFSEGKAGIVKKAIEGPVTSEVAASYLQTHPNTSFILDKSAAEKLQRFECPWTIKGVSHELETFDEQLMIKAVVWLSQKVNKPILRLKDEDYENNHLASLLRQEGKAFRVNIKVHEHLKNTITGWPAGGKPTNLEIPYNQAFSTTPKKIVIFSPHPDDDVICMGGTMLKLTKQGHEVYVAYQTSGNIAVFDHDARRFADFATEIAKAFNIKGLEELEKIEAGVNTSLDSKKAGDIDSKEVQIIKGLIRRTEARSAAIATGVKRENIHALDLPFYETGRVKKKPIGPEDIAIVKNFLNNIKPDQIYAAGDLTDPHGTHRVCLDAILQSFTELENDKSEWFSKCDVFLYRGAWQEWEPEKITMAVPMSPEELYAKRLAIFKHQSQKDPALFPGSDAREFWQRSEARNKKTAEVYDKLGLTEYEAIECFVSLKELRKYVKI
jgi:glucosamine-6-phosphate deaminase